MINREILNYYVYCPTLWLRPAASYTVAYVDFFDSQIKARGGDWKSVVSEYLYSGTEPLINGLAGGRT